jgi:hypothetical protein
MEWIHSDCDYSAYSIDSFMMGAYVDDELVMFFCIVAKIPKGSASSAEELANTQKGRQTGNSRCWFVCICVLFRAHAAYHCSQQENLNSCQDLGQRSSTELQSHLHHLQLLRSTKLTIPADNPTYHESIYHITHWQDERPFIKDSLH